MYSYLNKVKSFFIVQKRHLTEGEKLLIRSIFDSSIDRLDYIYIIAHRLVLKDYAISPNGHIYFNSKNWKEDFSKENIELQSWLIHEMVHVWQVQQGINLLRKAFFDRRYQYVISMKKSFLDYGVEQQAQIVQDYFLKLKKGQKCDDLQACIPFSKKLN